MVSLNHINSGAIVPDQLISYVKAVSGLESRVVGNCVLHHADGFGVLVGFPVPDPLDIEILNVAIEEAFKIPGLKNLTVLSAIQPSCARLNSISEPDSYWVIDLPHKPSSKLANMLRRATQEVRVETGNWNTSHKQLTQEFCSRKNFDQATNHIFNNLEEYLANSLDSVLFSAYDNNNKLTGFAIGDYSSLSTAFYMFAVRDLAAPPGTADFLLDSLIKEASLRGHSRINLGLGINQGVEFFKKKWNARKWFPYYETSWKKKSWFSRLFRKL